MGSPISDGVVASPSCGQWLTSSGKQRLQAGHSFIYWPGTKRNDGKKDFATPNRQRWQSQTDSNGCGGEQATDKIPSSKALNSQERSFLKARRHSWHHGFVSRQIHNREPICRPTMHLYRTTTFTSRCGTTITLTTSCPSMKARIFSSLRAAVRSSSSVTSGKASTRERSFPFT